MEAYSIAFRISILAAALGAIPSSAQTPAASSEQGMASWYGDAFNGQHSASGELYDQEQLTAAHRTLPFGTRVLVRRLDSPQSIVVRINDRGPYVESRIIDLSYAAARRLGMTGFGLVPVALEVVEIPLAPAPESICFAVQAGSFRNPDNARRARDAMAGQYGAAIIVSANGLFRVEVGRPSPIRRGIARRRHPPQWKSVRIGFRGPRGPRTEASRSRRI